MSTSWQSFSSTLRNSADSATTATPYYKHGAWILSCSEWEEFPKHSRGFTNPGLTSPCVHNQAFSRALQKRNRCDEPSYNFIQWYVCFSWKEVYLYSRNGNEPQRLTKCLAGYIYKSLLLSFYRSPDFKLVSHKMNKNWRSKIYNFALVPLRTTVLWIRPLGSDWGA